MFVAINTTEQTEVVGYRMAVCALVPLIVVFSAVNREVHIIVVEGGRLPGILTMTQRTIGGESCRSMVGIVH